MYWLYNLLLILTSPLWVVWMLVRTLRRSERPDWGQRMGNLRLPPRPQGSRIWLHAVSVGEVVAAQPVMRAIRQRMPEVDIVLSVTTSSGHRTAREVSQPLHDHLIYMPLDLARFQLSAMQQVRPDVVAIMETELWFNFLWAAKVFDAATFLVNGRVSDRAFPRNRRLSFFYRPLLAQVDRCLMQGPLDAERIRAMGASSAEVFGNVKFDQAAQPSDPVAEAALAQELGLDQERPVVVFGSGRIEEMDDLVRAAAGLASEAQVILAPRHIETVEAWQSALERSVPVARRSSGGRVPAGGVLLLDTYGELDRIYARAQVAVVGGGFADLGGQNVIQPLARGVPVVCGRHMQNFRDVVAAAAREDCLLPVPGGEIAETVRDLLRDPGRRAAMGARAAQLVRANLGASERIAGAIAEAIERMPARDRKR